MATLIIMVFVIGYLAIALEHPIKINKAASALITGVICWTIYIVFTQGKEAVLENLTHHLGEMSQILFFLLGAMTIVELIDAHDGFDIITQRITTRSKRKLIWIVTILTFFLSAVLDNLTTTIVMISLIRKIMEDRNDRLFFVGAVVIAANAGGAWSPIGDVTTTMLWIGGQITAGNIVVKLILPSIACLLAPLLVISFMMKGEVRTPLQNFDDESGKPSIKHRNIVFGAGIGVLLMVPIFKTVTHLPPFMGILMGLGVLWLIVELMHAEKDEADRKVYTVAYALRKIDTPSILFFLGVLLAIAALESTHQLEYLATWMDSAISNQNVVVMSIGLLSSIVDNVPLVAAAMGMYDLNQYPPDHYFWEFLAYCTGTGGSALIIGSAAGVAAMGMEKIDFLWYVKKFTWLALLGFFTGAIVYILQARLLE